MQLSSEDLQRARSTVETILNEIGLETFLFEIEPREGQWEIKLECPIDEGWEIFNLTASDEYLIRGENDAVVHEFLKDEWTETLKNCKQLAHKPA